jgi:hypothetical protein
VDRLLGVLSQDAAGEAARLDRPRGLRATPVGAGEHAVLTWARRGSPGLGVSGSRRRRRARGRRGAAGGGGSQAANRARASRERGGVGREGARRRWWRVHCRPRRTGPARWCGASAPGRAGRPSRGEVLADGVQLADGGAGAGHGRDRGALVLEGERAGRARPSAPSRRPRAAPPGDRPASARPRSGGRQRPRPRCARWAGGVGATNRSPGRRAASLLGGNDQRGGRSAQRAVKPSKHGHGHLADGEHVRRRREGLAASASATRRAPSTARATSRYSSVRSAGVTAHAARRGAAAAAQARSRIAARAWPSSGS